MAATTIKVTTVKVTQKTDDALETLAARLYLKTHRKVTKQELIELLVRVGREDEDSLVALIARLRFPIPDAQWKRWLRDHVSDWGVVTREAEIDPVLYGGDEG